MRVRVQEPKGRRSKRDHLGVLGAAGNDDDASLTFSDVVVDSETHQAIDSHIEEIEFERCHLTNTYVNLPSSVRIVRFTDCSAQTVAFTGGRVVHIIRSRFVDCKLDGLCFSEGTLFHGQFRSCLLNHALFRFARLRNCLFDSCQLASCDFDGAMLQEVAFRGSRLSATFNGVSVKGTVDLRGAELGAVRPVTALRGFTADLDQVIGLAVPLAKGTGIIVPDGDG